MKLGVVLVVLVAIAAGCSNDDHPSAAPATSTTSTTVPATTSTTTAPRPAVTPTGDATVGSLRTTDGRTRTYRLYVPPDLPTGEDVPLLIALHGGTGSGGQFEINSGFDGIAEANHFVVVYPDGIGIGAQGTQLRTWNGGACCGPAVKQKVDDVAFIDQLITKLEGTLPIDHRRVYAAGHSNGGILAYRLACELADRIAAIGVQSTSLEIDDCHPSRPVSLLHIHGTADQNIPIDGGNGSEAISGVSFNPPVDGVKTIAAADGCDDQPSAHTDGDLTRRSWKGCDDGTSVEFLTVAGAPHAWMGHTAARGPLTEPYMGLDSSAEIWTFLAAHGR